MNNKFWDNFRLNLAISEILKSCQEQNDILCGGIKDWNNIDEKSREDLREIALLLREMLSRSNDVCKSLEAYKNES